MTNNEKLRLAIHLLRQINADGGDMVTDLYTCFNHAENEHHNEVIEVIDMMEGCIIEKP